MQLFKLKMNVKNNLHGKQMLCSGCGERIVETHCERCVKCFCCDCVRYKVHKADAKEFCKSCCEYLLSRIKEEM